MKKSKRVCILFALTVLMLCMLSACGKKETLKGIGGQETEPSQDVAFLEDVIQYGDTIRVSCHVTVKDSNIVECGEREFVVNETSDVFCSEFEDSLEFVQKNVKEAVGTPEGACFILWFEGGDGLYGYEYQVQEIANRNREIVEPGDEVRVSIVEYTDAQHREIYKDGIEVSLVLPEEKPNISYEPKRSCYELYPMQAPEKIVGKAVGESFTIVKGEKEIVYTVEGITKTVRYGDKIKTSLRIIEYMAGEERELAAYAELDLNLRARSGRIQIGEYLLSEELTRELLKTAMGNLVGGWIWISDELPERRMVYRMKVEALEKNTTSADFPEKGLMLAEEENIQYFCDEIGNRMFVAVYLPEEQDYVIYEYLPENGEQKEGYRPVTP